MKKSVLVMDFNGDKKIAAIKGIRAVSNLGLKEAKDVIDHIQLHHTPVEIPLWGGWSVESAITELAACDILAQDSEPTPLSIPMLALKLAMRGIKMHEVEALADDLYGIEDASGSLRAAAEMMKEVAP